MNYKKRVNIAIAVSIIFLILSLSMVSAFSFSEFFKNIWKGITGKATGETPSGYIQVANLKNEYEPEERIELTEDSKINNTGEIPIQGYLSMKVQKYVDGNWYDHKIIVGTSETGNYNCEPHTADYDEDWRIDYNELQRVIDFYSNGSYHCNESTEDGYAPGEGSHDCESHSSDYSPQNWKIEGSVELTRIIQIYNIGAYNCNSSGEDGYSPLGWEVPGREIEVLPGGYLALDDLWANADYFIPDETGQYRVYAALLGADRKVIETETGKLEDTYEFEVK